MLRRALAELPGVRMAAVGSREVTIEGRRLKLSNLDKVLYPKVGFTKAHVIDYYVRIAPALLPHLHGRPLTLKRYPEGVEGFHFYEKKCPTFRPEWVKTTPVWSTGHDRHVHYCLCEDLSTLVWVANLADLELHTSLSKSAHLERPTMLVFDLDPGAPADLVQCAQVGLLLRRLFEQLELELFPKTSGSKGLQLYVPLNTPVTYAQTKPFAQAVAQLLEKWRPDLVVSNMKKSLRGGKVLIDWSQNDVHKTTVCVYSLRAKDRPTVSTPVKWTEVERLARARDPSLLVFDSEQAIARYEKQGDLFEPVLRLKQRLPSFDRVPASIRP